MKTFTILAALAVSSAVAFPASIDNVSGQEKGGIKDSGNINPEHLQQLVNLVTMAKAASEPAGQDLDVKKQVIDLIQKALDAPVAPVAPTDPAQPDETGDVSNVLTDIVNTITAVNGLNSLDVNDEEVVTNLVGVGNVDVLAGSSGTTTEIRLGDLVNTIGAIQGHWYTFNIENVNVAVNDD